MHSYEIAAHLSDLVGEAKFKAVCENSCCNHQQDTLGQCPRCQSRVDGFRAIYVFHKPLVLQYVGPIPHHLLQTWEKIIAHSEATRRAGLVLFETLYGWEKGFASTTSLSYEYRQKVQASRGTNTGSEVVTGQALVAAYNIGVLSLQVGRMVFELPEAHALPLAAYVYGADTTGTQPDPIRALAAIWPEFAPDDRLYACDPERGVSYFDRLCAYANDVLHYMTRDGYRERWAKQILWPSAGKEETGGEQPTQPADVDDETHTPYLTLRKHAAKLSIDESVFRKSDAWRRLKEGAPTKPKGQGSEYAFSWRELLGLYKSKCIQQNCPPPVDEFDLRKRYYPSLTRPQRLPPRPV